jgi:hypothetical protein
VLREQDVKADPDAGAAPIASKPLADAAV